MKRDSRLSGSMAGLVALVLLVAAASPAVQAQQRNIPIPASSASPGGVAAASAATIEDVRQTQSLIQNQGAYGRSWTSYFVGQQKCVNHYYLPPMSSLSSAMACATINSDGTITISSVTVPAGAIRMPTPVEVNTVEYTPQYSATLIASPVSDRFSGAAPTDWTFRASGFCWATDSGRICV